MALKILKGKILKSLRNIASLDIISCLPLFFWSLGQSCVWSWPRPRLGSSGTVTFFFLHFWHQYLHVFAAQLPCMAWAEGRVSTPAPLAIISSAPHRSRLSYCTVNATCLVMHVALLQGTASVVAVSCFRVISTLYIAWVGSCTCRYYFRTQGPGICTTYIFLWCSSFNNSGLNQKFYYPLFYISLMAYA